MSAVNMADTIRELMDRVEELERWRSEFLETEWLPMKADMRAVNEWVAEPRERDQPYGQCTPSCGWGPAS